MNDFYKLGVYHALNTVKLARNAASLIGRKAPTWDLKGDAPQGFRQPAPPKNVGESSPPPAPGTGPSTPGAAGPPNPPSPGGTPFSSPVEPNKNVTPEKPIPANTNPATTSKPPRMGGMTSDPSDVAGVAAATSSAPTR